MTPARTARRTCLGVWVGGAAAALLVVLVPLAVGLGLITATRPAGQVAAACVLPVLVGLALRAGHGDLRRTRWRARTGVPRRE